MEINYNHSIIMHQTYKNEIWEKVSLQRSNIQNTYICGCQCTAMDFSRSSFTNLRVEDCYFKDCIFLNTDIFFCKFTNCNFENCDFGLSEIENTNFYQCRFVDIKFSAARIANNYFLNSLFETVFLDGSITKFNTFTDIIWDNGTFGNCTIDYNITQRCKFIQSKINIEAIGSVWGLEKTSLADNTFLSLGREIVGDFHQICCNLKDYLSKKELYLELFVFMVSFQKENIFTSTELLLQNLDKRYEKGNYLSPDELTYFYEILKIMRKEFMLPLLILNQILMYIKKILESIQTDDFYHEKFILFYNNICLIYNAMMKELSSYNSEFVEGEGKCCIKMTFNEKPRQDVIQVINDIYDYVDGEKPKPEILFIKEEQGSYIIWLIMGLASLAAFNIGTLLLTGGVKHLVKLRASLEVLFSKKLPKKYYLDVYEKDESITLSKNIISLLASQGISALSQNLKNLSTDGINAQNIKEISEESQNSAYIS